MNKDKSRLAKDRILSTFNNLEKILADVVEMQDKGAISNKIGTYLGGILTIILSNMIELVENKDYYDKEYLEQIREAAGSFLNDQQLKGNMTLNRTDTEGES